MGALGQERLCAAHGGRTRGPDRRRGERCECATRPRCGCEAYAYPHRPGGGLCRWPDAPAYRSTRPADYRVFRLRRRPWSFSAWASAVRRAFDVTPPGVPRRTP